MSINGKNARIHDEDVALIDQALDELRRFPRDEWLDLARSDQSIRWRKGTRILAEAYFGKLPEVRDDVEEALVLINGEVQLRRELGDLPELVEYERRFPDLTENIALQFDVDRILSDTANTE